MDFLVNEPVTNEDGIRVFEDAIAIQVTDLGAMTIQIGANQYQEMDIRIPEISSESLYLDKLNVTIRNGSEKAMVRLDEAIARLNEVRSRIGAFQNRLEYAAKSLAETEEDMTAAYSNILDTDMEINMDTRLDDVDEWDSLSFVSFIGMAKSKTGKKVDLKSVNGAETIEDLYNLLMGE